MTERGLGIGRVDCVYSERKCGFEDAEPLELKIVFVRALISWNETVLMSYRFDIVILISF